MGQRMLKVVCATALVTIAVAPVASANHNTVSKADKADASLVKAYDYCTTPTIVDPTNSSPACPASAQAPQYVFGPKATATYKQMRFAPGKPIKDKAGQNRIPGAGDAHPADREANTTGDVLFTVTATDMLDSGSPLNGLEERLGGFSSSMRFGLTDDGCGGASCAMPAVVNVLPGWSGASPATFCAAGKCQFTTTFNTAVAEVNAITNPANPYWTFSFYYDDTNNFNLVVPNKKQNFEQTVNCTDTTKLCPGLLIGKADDSVSSSFNRPMKANKIQVSMVKSYVGGNEAPCSSGAHDQPFRINNACQPPVARSGLEFGSKGSGSVKIIPGQSATYNELKVIGSLKDLRSGPAAYDGPVNVRFNARVTHGECAEPNSVCTRPTQVTGVDGSCSKGTCKVVGVTDLQLPKGSLSSVEVGTVPFGGAANVPEGSVCFYEGTAAMASPNAIACTGVYAP